MPTLHPLATSLQNLGSQLAAKEQIAGSQVEVEMLPRDKPHVPWALISTAILLFMYQGCRSVGSRDDPFVNLPAYWGGINHDSPSILRFGPSVFSDGESLFVGWITKHREIVIKKWLKEDWQTTISARIPALSIPSFNCSFNDFIDFEFVVTPKFGLLAVVISRTIKPCSVHGMPCGSPEYSHARVFRYGGQAELDLVGGFSSKSMLSSARMIVDSRGDVIIAMIERPLVDFSGTRILSLRYNETGLGTGPFSVDIGAGGTRIESVCLDYSMLSMPDGVILEWQANRYQVMVRHFMKDQTADMTDELFSGASKSYNVHRAELVRNGSSLSGVYLVDSWKEKYTTLLVRRRHEENWETSFKVTFPGIYLWKRIYCFGNPAGDIDILFFQYSGVPRKARLKHVTFSEGESPKYRPVKFGSFEPLHGRVYRAGNLGLVCTWAPDCGSGLDILVWYLPDNSNEWRPLGKDAMTVHDPAAINRKVFEILIDRLKRGTGKMTVTLTIPEDSVSCERRRIITLERDMAIDLFHVLSDSKALGGGVPYSFWPWRVNDHVRTGWADFRIDVMCDETITLLVEGNEYFFRLRGKEYGLYLLDKELVGQALAGLFSWPR